jgi:hypothetical protein
MTVTEFLDWAERQPKGRHAPVDGQAPGLTLAVAAPLQPSRSRKP